MQVSVETTSGLGRKMTIQVPAQQIEKEFDKRVQDIAKKAKIDGFRPGKIPAKVIKQRFAERIKAEVAQEVMQATLYEALKEKDITPAGMPQVEPGDVDSEKDFEYVATFEVFPEITVDELDGADVSQVASEVKDEDVDSMLDKLRAQHKEWVAVERASKDGDKIDMDFEGFIGDEAFEGGKAEHFELELGSKSMIPGFEEGLVGLKAGDEKDLIVTFPENYGKDELSGKEACFKIKVHKVLEGQLPEVSEDFIKKFESTSDNVEDFKAEIKKNMSRELDRQLNQTNKDKVFTAMLDKNAIDLPKALIDREIAQLKQDMVKRVFGAQQPKNMKMPNLPDEMFIEQAKRRVHLGLLISEYVKKHDLKASPERVDAWLEAHAQSYDNPEEVMKWYRESKERMTEVEAIVVEDQVMEKMLEGATVKNVEESYDSVMNPKNQEGSE
jgi:trigger factor